MKMQPMALGKNCNACGAERKTKNLRYHPATLLPYCENPWICSNENHPNSPANLIKNQKETQLITFADANTLFTKELTTTFDQDTVEAVQKLMRNPQSIRIQDPEMAHFLIQFLKGNEELKNLSDTIRHCVSLVMENQGEFYKDVKIVKEKHERQVRAETAVKEIESSTSESKDDDNLTF